MNVCIMQLDIFNGDYTKTEVLRTSVHSLLGLDFEADKTGGTWASPSLLWLVVIAAMLCTDVRYGACLTCLFRPPYSISYHFPRTFVIPFNSSDQD